MKPSGKSWPGTQKTNGVMVKKKKKTVSGKRGKEEQEKMQKQISIKKEKE